MKNEQAILFYAFRYVLGRKTYAVAEVVETLIDEIDNIPENHKNIMRVTIENAIESGEAGHKMDVKEWRKVLDELNN